MTICFREKKERLVLWLDFEQNMTYNPGMILSNKEKTGK